MLAPRVGHKYDKVPVPPEPEADTVPVADPKHPAGNAETVNVTGVG